jgi:ribosomal protein L7/L12
MAPELAPEQRQAFADALYSGRKIEAIKQLRELSGLDLKEAKEIIDRLEADLRAAHPERFTKTSSKGAGCAVAFVLLILAGGGLLWLLLRR